MTSKQQTTPAMPLAGGDYVDKGNGLKQIAPSTAPPIGKSERTVARPAVTAAAEPAPASAGRSTAAPAKPA